MPDRATHGRTPTRATSDRTSEGPQAPGRAPTPRLSGEEELLVVVRGIGAVMFLTSLRLIVARDGMERRPRSGIQSFRLETIRTLKLDPGTAGSGRIVVATTPGAEAVSMFFDAKALERAKELVEAARPLIRR